ncbi:MAG TPA: AMP-binding protein [Candidatus Dormibacteraeota bacterium]
MTISTEDADLAHLACGMTAGSVRELLAVRACNTPERPAFSSAGGGRELTYGALAALSGQWKAALRTARLPLEARIGLWIDEPLDFIGTYLSCLAAGVTVVPFNPDAPVEDVERNARRLRLDLVATDRPERLKSGTVWHIQAGRPQIAVGPGRGPTSNHAGHRASVLLLTSGTTGDPKIVPLPEWHLLHRAQLVAAHHRLGAADRGYSSLPLFHVNAQVVAVLATLVAGSTLVTERRFHRTGFWDRMAADRITWINAVPAILAILAGGPRPDPATADRVRFARSASAPLSEAVLERFEERCGVRVLETYGMTEAAGQITANPLDPEHRRPGSAGLPVGIQLRVVDKDGRPVAVGARGLVEIRGAGVIDHYLVHSEPSNESIELRIPALNRGGWLPTGDLGHLDHDGYVFLSGRSDDVINCGGEKVYPREVEDLLRTDARVADAVLVGQADPVLGQCPVAVVARVEDTEPALLASDLIEMCVSRLSRAKRPRRLIVVDHLPTGSMGKVSRRLVERQLTSSSVGLLETHALVS